MVNDGKFGGCREETSCKTKEDIEEVYSVGPEWLEVNEELT